MNEKPFFREFHKKDPRKKAIEKAFSSFKKKKNESHPNKSDGFHVRSNSESSRKTPLSEVFDSVEHHKGGRTVKIDNQNHQTDNQRSARDSLSGTSELTATNRSKDAAKTHEEKKPLDKILSRGEFQTSFVKARNQTGFEKLKQAGSLPIGLRPKSSNLIGNSSTTESYNFEDNKRPVTTNSQTQPPEKTQSDPNNKMNTRFKMLAVLVDKKIKENIRIDEMLKVLKEKKLKDEEFHKRIRKNFYVTRNIRKDIDKNFNTLNTEYNINNYILVKRLEKVLLSRCPCYKKQNDDQCFKLDSGADFTNYPMFEERKRSFLDYSPIMRKEIPSVDTIAENSLNDSHISERSDNEASRDDYSLPTNSARTPVSRSEIRSNQGKMVTKNNAFKKNSRNISAERKEKDEQLFYKKHNLKTPNSKRESAVDIIQKFKIQVNGTKSVTFVVDGKTSEVLLNDFSSADVVFSSKAKSFSLFNLDYQNIAEGGDSKHSPEVFSKFKLASPKEVAGSARSSNSDFAKDSTYRGLNQLEDLEKKVSEADHNLFGNFSEILKFDPRNAYTLFMEMSKLEEKNKAVKKICLACTKKKGNAH